MITPEKYSQALHALHMALCLARNDAHESGNEELARVLDNLEILPKYFIEPSDRTDSFRQVLVDIETFTGRYKCLTQFFDGPRQRW